MILDDILRAKREQVRTRMQATSVSALRDRPLYDEPRRDFAGVLQQPGAIIAEVKKASPSRGTIRADFEPVAIARAYATHGAAAISVLTDEPFFQGRLDHVAAIRAAVSLPLLQKDFIIDPFQLTEARAFGADAVLLIVAALTPDTFTSLQGEARALKLDVLVEVHNERELDIARKAGTTLLGINNRDLRTFETTIETTERLLPAVPAGCTVVTESGINARIDIERLMAAGVHAFLIGETLMRAPDPGVRLDELRGAEV